MQQIMTPVSPGELLDKITILRIKRERFAAGEKRDHVLHELDLLEQAWQQTGLETAEILALVAELQQVNEQLWVIEDDIRDKERAQSFGAEFIALARSVYQRNDHRAALKKQINQALGSDLVEEKSYQAY
ncbi:MAG: DUF6165 family protein [Xanthomonadales bacterium]|nr:DUF6165 family protein [Xanthomonadales bacterium]